MEGKKIKAFAGLSRKHLGKRSFLPQDDSAGFWHLAILPLSGGRCPQGGWGL